VSAYTSLEETILAPIALELDRIVGRSTGATKLAYIDVLEAMASRLGGYDLRAYQRRFKIRPVLKPSSALTSAEGLLTALRTLTIAPPLALAALARQPTSQVSRRRQGEFYTDFRLATALAESMRGDLQASAAIVDPASGTGMLLVASVLAAAGDDRVARARLLRERVVAADLSRAALRGARLALSSLTDDLDAVYSMSARFRCWDSLLVANSDWSRLLPPGQVAVVANPPWEKVKLSRHEYLLLAGHERHYGAEYATDFDQEQYEKQRALASSYGGELAARYVLLGTGEPDLYKAFVELATRLAEPAGCIGMIAPAGLIRSQGTEDLRRFLVSHATSLEMQLLENRARFFAIDSRFKFLIARAQVNTAKRGQLRTVTFSMADGTPMGTRTAHLVKIPVSELRRLRPDLTVPEVAGRRAWRLFHHLSSTGERWATAGQWAPHFAREVDMSRDRDHFRSSRQDDTHFPVVEGRMVQQHRFGAKAYRSGTGRRAAWELLPPGHSDVQPQFWIAAADLPDDVRRRIAKGRVGFCDVTGQTNERSMLAAFIPPGVVCGNKVPTIIFEGDRHPYIPYLWLGIANSFTFDWLLRRVLTTSVNYFLLKSIPFPRIDLDSLPARRIADAAERLAEVDRVGGRHDPWMAGELRATIDAMVMNAYRIGTDDLALILDDFPLLDRGQPPLPAEKRSTVTRDLVMAKAYSLVGAPDHGASERVADAKQRGAVPFVPGEAARRRQTLRLRASV
jgi:hypothetical protein